GSVLAHLERALFEPRPPQAPPLDGSLRFLEGAGTRATLELVGDEVLALLRGGIPAEQVALVVPSLERWRAAVETVFASLEIPLAIEGRVRLAATPLGHALLSLLRFAWADGGRSELYSFLRSPYSGIPRTSVDFAEGRLRGRVVQRPERVEEETERLREAPLVALRGLLRSMLRYAYGLEAPPVGDAARLDLRCGAAVTALLDELEQWEQLAERL